MLLQHTGCHSSSLLAMETHECVYAYSTATARTGCLRCEGPRTQGEGCRQTDGEREGREDLGGDKDLTFILSLWTGLTATRRLTGGEGADKDGSNKRKRWRRTEIEKEARDNKKGTRGGQKTPKHKCKQPDKCFSPPVITSCRSACASPRPDSPQSSR